VGRALCGASIIRELVLLDSKRPASATHTAARRRRPALSLPPAATTMTIRASGRRIEVAARSQAGGSRLERSVRSESARVAMCRFTRAAHTHTARGESERAGSDTRAHSERERARKVGGQRERARWRGTASQPLSVGPRQQSVDRESSD
jgi:hypothetical protein